MSEPYKPICRADFERMWNAGVKVTDIAETMQCSISTVSQRARRFGLVPRAIGGNRRGNRPPKDYSAVIGQFAEMVATGATVRTLASRFRMSTRTVCRLKGEIAVAVAVAVGIGS